jgi:hypothetical protein
MSQVGIFCRRKENDDLQPVSPRMPGIPVSWVDVAQVQDLSVLTGRIELLRCIL